MARLPYVRRRQHLGAAYRLAVFVLYPIMRWGFHWEYHGRERLINAQGGIIVAPNHISYVDPMVISYLLWECDRPPRFLVKEGILRIPVIGAIVRNAGQIPVYRESAEAVHAIRDAIVALEDEQCVVIYPEGTVTRDPDLWPMKGKTGAVRLALVTGRPLYPVAQWGPQDVMRPYVKEFRLLPRKLMRLSVGEPVDLSDLADRPLNSETLTVGTNRLIDAITALEADLRGEKPPETRLVFRRGQVQGSVSVAGDPVAGDPVAGDPVAGDPAGPDPVA